MSEVQERASSKERTGTVLSNKMDKTVVVEVVRKFRHPKYPKTMKRKLRYKAHDADNTCQIGDTVLITECRPLSKTKRWTVDTIVKKSTMV